MLDNQQVDANERDPILSGSCVIVNVRVRIC